MEGFSEIVGHQRSLKTLKRALVSGHLSQAYLFYGPRGVGKATCALAWGQILLCREGSGCGRCPSCLKAGRGSHPDFLLVSPQGSQISIASIRELKKWLSFSPLEGLRRVVILDEAEKLGREAANALLKILEEPPEGTHFVLVAPREEDLLPTIVSRCQRLYFGPLSPQETEKVLLRRGLSPEEARFAAGLALGSPGEALRFIDEGGLTSIKETFSSFMKLGQGSPMAVFRLVQRIGTDRDKIITFLKAWALLLREHQLKGPTPFVREALSQINKAILALERAANPRLTLEALLLRLSRL